MILQESHAAIPAERKKRIMEYIEASGSAQIKELALVFAVSEATVRRDLAELDDEGRIERTHGGAILRTGLQQKAYFPDSSADFLAKEKKAIAQYAATLVGDGESIYLDAGSITYQLAQCLTAHHSLSLVTSDLRVAGAVVFHPTTSVIVTGGSKKGSSNVLTGAMTASFLRGIHVDKCFLSADAIDFDYGISDVDFSIANVKKMAMGASHKVFLLADHTRFGKTMFAKICDMDEISLIISDKALEESYIRRMKQHKIAFYLA